MRESRTIARGSATETRGRYEQRFKHWLPAAMWPDPDDLPFVAAALATERKIVVTLNPRDFAPARAFGVRVLSPSQARVVLPA